MPLGDQGSQRNRVVPEVPASPKASWSHPTQSEQWTDIRLVPGHKPHLFLATWSMGDTQTQDPTYRVLTDNSKMSASSHGSHPTFVRHLPPLTPHCHFMLSEEVTFEPLIVPQSA